MEDANGSKLHHHHLQKLHCSVKNYDWGLPGRVSQVARLSELNFGSQFDPEKPYAELWMGTHDSGPSFLISNGTKSVTLKAWISENPDVLGDKVVQKWGSDLPFLFKVLSVGKALSIQAHPDKELARMLHKLQPDVYKDGNHKPEMALAMTDFEALCGFITLKELKAVFHTVPEVVELVGAANANLVLQTNDQDGEEKVKPVLQTVFTHLMSAGKEIVTDAVNRLKSRLHKESEEIHPEMDDKFCRGSDICGLSRSQGHMIFMVNNNEYYYSAINCCLPTVRQLTEKEQLVLRLEIQYPADIGVIAAFFLNNVKLNPGEALFLGANEPHAYLSGECVECMATSDNVVRAGLTPKFRDVQTLCSMLTYKQGFPEILRGVPINPYVNKYTPPFEEFEIDHCILPRGERVVFPAVPGPSIFLVTAGEGMMNTGSPKAYAITEGDVLFAAAYTEISVASASELHLYRTGVNSKIFQDSQV